VKKRGEKVTSTKKRSKVKKLVGKRSEVVFKGLKVTVTYCKMST
jgi:hypothetical protein